MQYSSIARLWVSGSLVVHGSHEEYRRFWKPGRVSIVNGSEYQRTPRLFVSHISQYDVRWLSAVYWMDMMNIF